MSQRICMPNLVLIDAMVCQILLKQVGILLVSPATYVYRLQYKLCSCLVDLKPEIGEIRAFLTQ